MPRSVVNLAISLLFLALSLGAVVIGARPDNLYADPGRPEAATPSR